jgi:hypothetical protein
MRIVSLPRGRLCGARSRGARSRGARPPSRGSVPGGTGGVWGATGLSLLLVLAVLGPTEARGQVSNPSASGGAGYEAYRFSSGEAVGFRSVSLATTPFSAGAEIAPAVRLRVAGAWATGRLERSDGSSASLQGLVDTEFQVEATLGADRMRVAGVVQLPTGHSGYTMDEAEVAGIVAADVLPFRLSSWGAGGGAGLHTSVAHRAGEFGVGASVSYLVGREFEVFAGEDRAYRPGNQLAVGLAGDRTVGRSGKAAVQLRMVRYGEDRLEGSNLFRSGHRYQAVGSYAFAAPRYSSAMVYGGVMHRSQGTYLAVPDTSASQDLLLAGAVVRMPVSWGVLVPSADLRALRSSDGTGQGYTTSVGGSAERAVGDLSFIPHVRARFGRVVVHQGARSGFVGWDLGLTARFGRTGS